MHSARLPSSGSLHLTVYRSFVGGGVVGFCVSWVVPFLVLFSLLMLVLYVYGCFRARMYVKRPSLVVEKQSQDKGDSSPVFDGKEFLFRHLGVCSNICFTK